MRRKVRAGGGWQAIFYTVNKAVEVGPIKLWRRMRSKNACKTCALGMGGMQGGMVNEAGHFPEVCKKSLQAQAADMQGGVAGLTVTPNMGMEDTMPKKKAQELTDQERAKRIKEIAREVEADETGEAFRRVIEKVTSDRRDPRRNSRKSSRAG